jgi:hypothetical protein
MNLSFFVLSLIICGVNVGQRVANLVEDVVNLSIVIQGNNDLFRFYVILVGYT